jgi:hypothetical protein
MTMAITHAKTGRSMKKRAMSVASVVAGGGGRSSWASATG